MDIKMETDRKEEGYYQIVFNEAPLGIYTLTEDGTIDTFNPEMTKLAGSEKAEDVIGLNALTLPTYREVGLNAYFERGLKGEPFTVPVVKYVSYTGGKTSYRSYKGVPIKNASGEVVRLLLFVQDITEKVEIEEAREYADKLAVVVEQSPDAMIVSSPDNTRTIEYWNKGAETIFGWKKEEIIGKSAAEILMSETARKESDAFLNELSQKPYLHKEVKRKHKDGHEIVVELYAFPILDKKDGNIRRLAFILRDITQRKEAEERLLKQDEELKEMNSLMVGRELKMIELKQQIAGLEEKLKTMGK